MTAVAYLADVANAADVLRQGSAHPVLGGLIDLGTSVRITAQSAGPYDEPSLRTAIVTACDGLAPNLRIVHICEQLTVEHRVELESSGAEHRTIVVLFLPEDAALVVVAGPDLPAMGALPDGDLAALRSTLLTLIGRPSDTDNFLNEPHAGFDTDRERTLTDRLRQLYGE